MVHQILNRARNNNFHIVSLPYFFVSRVLSPRHSRGEFGRCYIVQLYELPWEHLASRLNLSLKYLAVLTPLPLASGGASTLDAKYLWNGEAAGLGSQSFLPVWNRFSAHHLGKGAQQEVVQSSQVTLWWYLLQINREVVWTRSSATRPANAHRSAREMPKSRGDFGKFLPVMGWNSLSKYIFSYK